MTQHTGWYAAVGAIVVTIFAIAHAARHVYRKHRDFSDVLREVGGL